VRLGVRGRRWFAGADLLHGSPLPETISPSWSTRTSAGPSSCNLQLYGLVKPEDRGLLELPYDARWRPDQYDRFLKNKITRDAEGRIRIPEEPGLGVEVDWDVIQRFGARVYLGSKMTVAAGTLFDHGLRDAIYLANKKKALEAWSARAEFKAPEPPF
jgi:hypothetical protein